MSAPEEKVIPVTEIQIAELETTIAERLVNFKRKRKRNKTGFIVSQCLSIVASAGTTVFVGWQISDTVLSLDLKNVALALSAVATALTTLNATFDYKALWVCYNIAISQLKMLQSRLGYLRAMGVANIEQKDLMRIFEFFEQICQSVEKDYKNTRMSDE